MGFHCGIVGLPNVGKSTLFNALTAAHAPSSNYPFCTIDPNVGVVAVPDSRLDALASIYRPEKVIPTTLQVVDIAGLVKGASQGEGLGNQFLSHIRDVDAIVHIVRCFDDPNVVHVDGSVNPRRDVEVVEAELILRDCDTVERKIDDARRRAKSGDKKVRVEEEFYERVRDHLLHGRLSRYFSVPEGEAREWMRSLHLLTDKPVMYVCNTQEGDLGGENAYVEEVRSIAAREGAPVVTVSARLEEELVRLPEQDRGAFLRDLGIAESSLTRIVHGGYGLLHLITYFTVGAKEVHARTLRRGQTAVEAAGAVHTDFARGFIRADIMRSDDLVRLGSEHAVREQGLLRAEGRDYVVQDGDVVYIRFNV